MTYTRFDHTSLYLPAPASKEITYGYYLPGDAGPVEISPADSWNVFKGYYFFLSRPIEPAAHAELLELEKALAAEPALQDPHHTGASWWVNTAGSLAVCQAVLQTELRQGRVIVEKEMHLGFGKYRLPLFPGSAVLFDPEGLLSVGYPAVAGAQPSTTENGLSIAVMGRRAGILTGQVMISDFSDNEHTGWMAGFRYNMPGTFRVFSQYYPLFRNEAGIYWVFNVHWDPLHPLDHNRSNMAFTGISLGMEKIAGTKDRFRLSPSSGQTMDSWWRTIYGQPVTIRPVTDGPDPAQLVFQLYANPDESPAYYLAPKGSFELGAVPEEDGMCRLLPGLAGTESLQFTPGDTMVFYPGNAAYAADGLASKRLDDSYTASWAFIQARSASAIVYSAAPSVASLYQPSATAGMLDAYYAPTAQLPAAGGDAGCFPMAPYAGVDVLHADGFPADTIALFEKELIAVTREQRMAALPPPPMAFGNASIVTTTPQGLLATISGLQWEKVLLAKNIEENPGRKAEVKDFQFRNLPAVLRRAFQTDDLFLVISDATHLGEFDNAVLIEGWQFNINVPIRDPMKDPEHKNILVFKFRKGAVTDLLEETNQWTDPVPFNYDENQVESTRSWLRQYCEEAIAMSAQNAAFASFAAIVQDAEWYGVLAFRTDIDLGNFPEDLKGLLGAMDLTRFYAHHVGVQVNFVQENTSDAGWALDIKRSNLFGLISYIDPAYQQTQREPETTFGVAAVETADNSMEDVTYVYKVLILQVIFADTVLTDFNSKLELTARKWFEDAASLNIPGGKTESEPANYSMIFNGHYENHDGHRTYTFLTQQDLTYQYFLTSKVLTYIEFVKAQFQTVSHVTSREVADVEKITARFTFYGFLNFKILGKTDEAGKPEEFDCFSYGSEAGEEIQHNRGLYFSNLALDVNFALNTSTNSTSGLKIILNPANVSFDQSMSSYRQKSFAAAFPISPNAVLQGSGDNTPKRLGYVKVIPPVKFDAGIQSLWYAINFDMHWGGPGSLSSQAGFMPQLMLAWSPGASAVQTELFIRLPGSGSGNDFVLQNVMKVSAGPFQLKQVKHDGKISYNFFLINLSLSIFGVRLPPFGNSNLVLIGDADDPGTLGWFGAYKT